MEYTWRTCNIFFFNSIGCTYQSTDEFLEVEAALLNARVSPIIQQSQYLQINPLSDSSKTTKIIYKPPILTSDELSVSSGETFFTWACHTNTVNRKVDLSNGPPRLDTKKRKLISEATQTVRRPGGVSGTPVGLLSPPQPPTWAPNRHRSDPTTNAAPPAWSSRRLLLLQQFNTSDHKPTVCLVANQFGPDAARVRPGGWWGKIAMWRPLVEIRRSLREDKYSQSGSFNVIV